MINKILSCVEKWSELSERQKEILRPLKENPRITRAKLSEKLGINPSAVQKHLRNQPQKFINPFLYP
ncbi:MAG: hypothetical protein DRP13_02085 [Candidatus Aenigmatarchaeota archaeon]|nr:MAG: hypothetical protein DRP13_02085 [Candidatus Aenigmarchaeota archaeon]